MEEIILQGNKKELIEILESHIAYLQASGYDNSGNPYDRHPELNICYVSFFIFFNKLIMYMESSSSFSLFISFSQISKTVNPHFLHMNSMCFWV